MITHNNLYEKFESLLVGHYNFDEHENILKYQIVLLKILIILSTLLIGSMSIVRLYEGEMIQSAADFIFVLILSVNFYFLHNNKQHFKVISRIVISSALLTIVVLMHNIPESFSHVVWITTTIYLMFFLLSRKEAWKWLLVVLLLLIILYISGFALNHFKSSDIFILIGNIFLLSLVLTWYEKIKEDNEEQYIKNKILLESEVAKKTQELSALNANLEKDVEVKTDALRTKDKIMLAQSRQAAMGDMISMIAHQWRQPITAIGMGAQNMQLDIELEDIDPKRFDTKLTKIVEQTEFLSKTIDDFRNFLKPNKKPKKCMLSKMVEDTLAIIGKSLENNNVTLKKSFENDIEIETYCNEIIQVLLNIINNAKDIIKIKKMDDGIIEIFINSDEENVYFKICDNAGGIPDDVLPKIFEPYYTTKDEKGGTGLGLYMSLLIVQKHLNGTITAKNINEGACFKISIPKITIYGELND